MSIVQYFKVVPLIIAAEAYENADTGHTHGAAASAGHGHAVAAGANADEAWAPADGLERTLHTLMANLLVGVTFALLLTAGIIFSGREISAYSGLMWGGAGFVIFVAAPIMGLPPELPRYACCRPVVSTGLVAGDSGDDRWRPGADRL